MIKKLVLLLIISVASTKLSAAIIYVNMNASGANDGSSWSNAFIDLQDAITLSVFGDEIWVAQGVYKPTTGNSRSINFTIKNGTKLYGGFTGVETILSERDVDLNLTVLSGEIGTGAASDNSYVIAYFNNVANQTQLDGFTVTGAYHNGVSAYGGGAKVVASSPTIANCSFQGNYAEDGGGAINHSTSGILTLENCVFDGNVGNTYGGGALRLYSATVNISGCYFKSNQSDTYAGAIYISDAIVNISRSVFAGNISQTSGSAIRIGDIGTLHMDNCLVVGNYTNTSGTITTSTFSNTSSHTITNCTIAHNKDDNSGGSSTASAVSLNDEATITNSIIYGNQSINQVLGTGLTFNYNLTENSSNNATGTNILYTNPQFEQPGVSMAAPFDTTGYNYHLGILSNGIDVGSNANVVGTTDLGGNLRIQNGTVDIGAYEANYCVSTNQFTTSAPYTICGGTPITLEVLNGVSYSWSTGSTSSVITVNSAGTYSVLFEDSNGCLGNLSATVTSSSNPAPSISFAGGTLSTSGSYTMYQWYYNGTLITGSTANTHVPIQGYGVYEVIVQNASGCEGNSTYCLSPAAIDSSGPTTFCDGEDVDLFVTNGDSYVWTTGSLNASITVTTSGTYSVTVFNNSAGCSVVLEQVVTVNPSPNPSITFNGQELTTGTFTNYQWNYDGSSIIGATNQTLDPGSTGNGQYTVTVSNQYGCETTSSIFNLTNLSVIENDRIHVLCFPNPNNGEVNISSESTITRVELVNALGQTIDTYPAKQETIEINGRPGVYFLKISTKDGETVVRIVKQ